MVHIHPGCQMDFEVGLSSCISWWHISLGREPGKKSSCPDFKKVQK